MINSKWQTEKEELGRRVMELAYKSGCIETIFNTKNPDKRKNGWIFKDGSNSIYFINFRKIGKSPELTYILSYAMRRVIEEEIKPDYDNSILIGVDMAGIPLVSAISESAYIESGYKIKWGYTRPLPGEKIRTPDEADERLKKLKHDLISLGKWGEHNLIEGELFDGCDVIITDDVANNLGSKLIARKIIEYEAEKLNVDVNCDKVLVGANRQQGADEAAEKENMKLFYVVPMRTKGISYLEDLIPEDQFYYLELFVKDPSLFQDIDRDREKDKNKGKNSPLMEDALRLAASL